MPNAKKPKTLKPLSLDPLTPEQALRAFMQVDAKELQRREEQGKEAKTAQNER